MTDRTRRRLLGAAPAVAALAAGLVPLATSAPARAQAQGYEPIEPPQNTSTPDAVEVVEFFWLGCPHCYAFEPYIEDWKADMPSGVALVREAPPLNPSWEQHSRAFYAARALGHEDEFVHAAFEAIHQDGKRLRKPAEIAEVAASVGMDPEEFEKTMSSFTVETALRRSVGLARGAGLTGVPTVVINGKYRTGASLAGGNAGMIDVIDRMVAIEKRSLGLE